MTAWGKRIIALLLLIPVLGLCGCAPAETKTVTCEDVVSAYETAGYDVFHLDTTTEDYQWECYVKAEDQETGEYIFFHFFDTNESAESYAETRQYNVLIWLFSVIYGDPSWQTTKTYQNIEIEYDESYLYDPFKELIR